MLLISSDSLIICVFIDIIIHISTFSSEIDNRILVGVLQNGPKPQLSILKNMHYFIDLKIMFFTISRHREHGVRRAANRSGDFQEVQRAQDEQGGH